MSSDACYFGHLNHIYAPRYASEVHIVTEHNVTSLAVSWPQIMAKWCLVGL